VAAAVLSLLVDVGLRSEPKVASWPTGALCQPTALDAPASSWVSRILTIERVSIVCAEAEQSHYGVFDGLELLN
jgi:hypothetical protein